MLVLYIGQSSVYMLIGTRCDDCNVIKYLLSNQQVGYCPACVRIARILHFARSKSIYFDSDMILFECGDLFRSERLSYVMYRVDDDCKLH